MGREAAPLSPRRGPQATPLALATGTAETAV